MDSLDQGLLVEQVLRAVGERDLAVLTGLLHPYLHWTVGGQTIRGRRRVLARLAEHPAAGTPVSVELRDGQVYRWTCDTTG